MRTFAPLSERVRLIALSLALAPLLFSGGARDSRAVSGPAPGIDDFLCYKTRTSRDSPRFTRSVTALGDDFESGAFDLRGPAALCPAADGQGDGVFDPDTQLQSYHIKAAGGFKHTRQRELRVLTRYFDHHLDTQRPERLLIPTGMSFSSTPLAPDLDDHLLDHYKCYKVRDARGFPKMPRGMIASVADPFEDRLYELRRAQHLCLPVDQDGLGIKQPQRSILCYQVRKARGETTHLKRKGIHTADFIGRLIQDSKKEESLCVEATLFGPGPDSCDTPAEILSFPATIERSVRSATTSPEDPFPSCGFDQGEHSVFFRLTAPKDGAISAHTIGSDYDTLLAAYAGECGNLTELGCNADATSAGQSQLGFGVSKGETYTLVVTSESGLDPDGGNLRLSVDFLECEGNCNENDACVDAIPIVDLPFEDRRVVANATYDPIDDAQVCGAEPGRGTVWYALTAPADGTLSIDTAGSDYDTIATILRGPCGALDAIQCQSGLNDPFILEQSNFNVGVLAGESLLIAVAEDELATGGGTVDLAVHFTPDSCGNGFIDLAEECDLGADAACPFRCTDDCTCAPGFDSCIDAIEIDSLPFTDITNTSLSTTSAADPAPTCSQAGRSVWYTLTPDTSGVVTLDTIVSQFDTVLSVYPGACGDFSESDEIVCDDFASFPNEYMSEVSFFAMEGETYSVQVSTYEREGAGNFLEFNARIDRCGNGLLDDPDEVCEFGNDSVCPGLCNDQCQCTTGIDACSAAEGVATFPFSDVRDVSQATSSFSDPSLSCGDATPLREPREYQSVWYAITPPLSGLLRADASASDYAAVLALHTGSCGNFAELACEGSAVVTELNVTAGETLYLEVAADEAGAAGVLSLDLTLEACGNDSLDPGEECDGSADAACPGACNAACVCDSEPTDVDECSSALNLPVTGSSTLTIPFPASTVSPSDPILSCASDEFHTTWYSVTPTADGQFVAIGETGIGALPSVILAAHQGDCGGLAELSCAVEPEALSSAEIRFDVLAGETYFVEAATLQNGTVSTKLHTSFVPATCGDGDLDPGEECDGNADGACPSACSSDCACTTTRDSCNQARQINGFPYRDGANTVQMSTSPGDPALSCGDPTRPQGGHSVWWSLTAPADGIVRANTYEGFGSTTFDTVLAAHAGTCGSMAEVACSDDLDTVRSEIEFPVLAGEEYLLEVVSKGDTPGGRVALYSTFQADSCGNDVLEAGEACDGTADAACPGECTSLCHCANPGDECATALAVPFFPYSVPNSTTNETSAPDDPPLSCGVPERPEGSHTLWYELTAPREGSIQLGWFFDGRWAVHSGTCGNLSEFDCATEFETISIPVVEGDQHFLELTSPGTTGGILNARVPMSFEPCGPDLGRTCPFRGRTCEDARPVPRFPFPDSRSRREQIVDVGPYPSCAPPGSINNAWWSFTADRDGFVIADPDTDYKTVSAVYAGSCGSLAELACDATPDDEPSFRFPVSAGETYFVQVLRRPEDVSFGFTAEMVFTFDQCGNGALDPGELCDGAFDAACPGACSAECGCAVATDVCDDAVSVSAFPFRVTQDASSATTNPGEPASSCGDDNSLWVKLDAPDDGFVTAGTLGSDYDTFLAAHSGACGGLSELACNDIASPGFGGLAQVRFPVSGGQSYWIEVGDDFGDPSNLRMDLSFDRCGNDVRDVGETCDGTDSAACPGACLAETCQCRTGDNDAFSFPDGRPERIDPDTATAFRVEVSDLMGTASPGSGVLYLDDGSGTFVAQAMTQLSPNEYSASLPASACGSVLRYFFTAANQAGEVLMSPLAGASRPYFVHSGDSLFVLAQPFANVTGWNEYGDAVLGSWERTDPSGDGIFDPASDADGVGQAFITGAAQPLRFGTTVLHSQRFDASSGPGAVYSYQRWFNSRFPDRWPGELPFRVDLSNDDGLTWTEVEQVHPHSVEAQGGWITHRIRIADFLTPTDQMRSRFTAEHLFGRMGDVEAGLDDVRVTTARCDP